MKIKQERQVRFDELIKYVWDKRIVEMNFKSKKGVSVYVHSDGDIDVNEVRYISKDDLFTITEEVEIDYDTRLDLIAVRKVGTVSRFENRSIQGVLVHFEGEVDYIYFQNPDGSIADLIWSKERGLIE
ncbi:hypothetical protein [Macrococcoides caseolyticum]|uniref:hypothetical protein n=1 Tax=Macrococcoides caseolyticum TaxID=69966 RepID=UPI000C320A7B|nr:hypothetical protein [Macrococcus caseolyticus]PKD98551.1 hypothetical protein CW719_07830 [Macrococcus caseolyticus]PKF18752.1 hypothetical protein CW717_07830 [Macrococcus caseolyticus]